MRAVITVIGKDMVGILAKISTECCNHNINVLEVTQSILQDMFAMIMMVDISKSDIPFTEFSDMLGKIGTCKAIEVADASANGAFLVKVILAVTFRSNILIQRTASLSTVELAQNIYAAKLSQMAVKTALARRSLGIDLGIKLLYCKLAVGIASEKADERFPTRCLISLFSHLFSP